MGPQLLVGNRRSKLIGAINCNLALSIERDHVITIVEDENLDTTGKPVLKI